QETGIYKDMLNIISLLEKNEWAEHCTSTVLGSLLESEITRLVSKEQPTPVVPDYASFEEFWSSFEHPFAEDDELKSFAVEIWNSCRAAMLNGGKS
ncbi:TPA: molecular chaperone DnaJ, partial [Salmonella enterica subsp. enterica serovar Muenchen]